MAAALLQNLKEELLKVKTFKLITRASHASEKLFWIIVAISGTVWFLYFMSFQFRIWNDNSTFKSRAKLNLSDIDYPAVTFCSNSANKYGIVERFGNYLNSDAKLNHEFISWLQNVITACVMDMIIESVEKMEYCPQSTCSLSDGIYNGFCIGNPLFPSACKV